MFEERKGRVKQVKKFNKKFLSVFFVMIALFVLGACGKGDEQTQNETKEVIFGVAPGPYGDRVTKAIKPGLEEKGYQVSVREFTDYIQPNNALANGEIQANLFQHTDYLETFRNDHNLDIEPIIVVPTLSMGIYSNKYQSLSELPDGATVAISNDPSNLARALQTLQDEGFIKIKENLGATKATEKDIIENPKNLEIHSLESATLPRSIETVDIALVPGNYAIAANLDISSALAFENQTERLKNVIAVRKEDVDSQLGKDIIEVVKSDAFRAVMEDPNDIFTEFGRPDWW